METLAQDVRYALRSLARRPGFAAVVVLTLALGFGANAALFSVVDAVLRRRLPFAAPEELAQVWERHERGSAANVVSPANFADWRREARGFADLAGYWRQPISLTGLGEPEEVQATIASPGIFRLLGVPAAAGRLLAEDDMAAGQFTGEAAVLSYDFWQRRFGGDPEVVGSSVTLGTSSVAIVGVAPPAARLVEPATDVWMPSGPTASTWAASSPSSVAGLPASRRSRRRRRWTPWPAAWRRPTPSSTPAGASTSSPSPSSSWATRGRPCCCSSAPSACCC